MRGPGSADTVRRQCLAATMARQIRQTPPAPLAAAWATYLLKSGHVSELNWLSREAARLLEQAGMIEGELVSAHLLPEAITKAIADWLQRSLNLDSQPMLRQRVQPSLLGGWRASLPQTEVDFSVRGRLSRLRRLLAELAA